jgi:two-component system, NtrC family, sensor kinase
LYNIRALTLARKLNFKLNAAQYLADLGYVQTLMEKYPEALKSFFQALHIAEDPAIEKYPYYFTYYQEKTVNFIKSSIISDTYHKMGHLYGYTGNTDKQILSYRETERIAVSIQDTAMLALVNMNLTWANTVIGKFDSALIFGNKSLAYYSGLSNLEGKRYYEVEALRNVGDIYRKTGNIGLAKQTLFKAIRVGEEQNNLSPLGYTYYSLAELYYGEKKPDSSLFYAKKALAVINEVKDESVKARIYDLLYSIYREQSQTDSAYAYLKLSYSLKDSLNNDERKKIREFQNMGFDEQLRLDELEKEKIQTQTKIRTYAMLAGIAVFMLIAFLLYRNNRNRKKANELLQQQKDEIAEQKQQVEKTLTGLKSTQAQLIHSEKMASLGELTAGIAHEIQNPLNFVNNFSEVNSELIEELKSEKSKIKRDEQLEEELLNDIAENEKKINHHGKRADAIVKGMLQHSQTSTGQKEPTDINKLADEYLRLAYHGLLAKDKTFHATLKRDFDENIGKVNIVTQDIGRVILNLINNAFYAVDEKKKLLPQRYEPTVSITTKKIGDKIEIKVADNGAGIPQKIVDKIFQPFFTTKPTGQGTGLGLSLSYDIVKAHGGEIKVNTKENEGTAFTISLPV